MNTESTERIIENRFQAAFDASVEAQTPEVTRETVQDSIDIQADPIRITKQLVVLADSMRGIETVIKGERAKLKTLEGAFDELIHALRTGTQTISGKFIVETDPRTNTERWFDAETGECLRECPISPERRQAKLPFTDADLDRFANGSEPPPSNDSFDDVTGFAGESPEDTDVRDPSALLDEAANVRVATVSEPPSQPTRRGRRA